MSYTGRYAGGRSGGSGTVDAASVDAAGAVMESDYNANTVLAATADNTPLPLTLGASTILARLAAGDIIAATPTQLRTLLALTIGTDVQAFDATLTALAAANWAANALPIGSGADTLTQTAFAANTFPARASTGNLVAKTITDFALTILDDADATASRTTLGLGTAAVVDTGTGAANVPTITQADARYAPKATFPVLIGVALSDETTTITTGTAKATIRAPFAFTLTAVRANVNTVSSSGLPTVDINEGGTTVLSTKLTIDASEFTSTTAATAAVISDSAIADDAELTFDIDVAGTGAKGLKVWLIGTRVLA